MIIQYWRRYEGEAKGGQRGEKIAKKNNALGQNKLLLRGIFLFDK